MGREEETSPSVPASEGNECLPWPPGWYDGEKTKPPRYIQGVAKLFSSIEMWRHVVNSDAIRLENEKGKTDNVPSFCWSYRAALS